MFSALKREASRHGVTTIFLEFEPTTVETVRAAIRAGYLNNIRLSPRRSKFTSEVKDAAKVEAYEMLERSVVRGDLGSKA